MNNKTKPKFNAYTDLPHGDDDQRSTADLGIEFVHFDADDNPESVQTIPLGKFISDTPLSSEEYFMTRSLVAAQAAKQQAPVETEATSLNVRPGYGRRCFAYAAGGIGLGALCDICQTCLHTPL